MEHKIRDEGDPRKYWIQVPNIVDDTNMSVHAFRLYIHMKRVAGDDGTCWQSTRTLAEACNMSSGMVTKAKQELAELKLISISQEKNPRGGRAFHVVKIKDIWGENAKKYSTSSPHELASSPHELTSSPGELKKNPIKKNTIKNKEEEEGLPNIFQIYLDNIGVIGGNIMADTLIDAEETYPFNWIEEAIGIAVKNNARRWAYIEAILQRWQVEGKDNGYKPTKKQEEDAIMKVAKERGLR